MAELGIGVENPPIASIETGLARELPNTGGKPPAKSIVFGRLHGYGRMGDLAALLRR